MKPSIIPKVKDLVLIGGGHSHLSVLRGFGMKPLEGVQLTLITKDVHTPYSGMLHGYVAGWYKYDDIHIDLYNLSTFADAILVQGEVIGVDVERQRVVMQDRPPISYDVLSINSGITPAISQVPGAQQFTTPVKPISRFVQRVDDLLKRVQSSRSKDGVKVVIVGGGAGGVEVAFALHYRLQQELTKIDATNNVVVKLISKGKILGNSVGRSAVLRIMQQKGLEVIEEDEVQEVSSSLLNLKSGRQVEFDECLWCTNASAAQWIQNTQLPKDDAGFISVNDYLQCDGDGRTSNIFAAGDIATNMRNPTPKAGVFAVRQGPILAENLRNMLQGKELQKYEPQRSFLSLISTGNQYAVGVKGWIKFEGQWAWNLKDYIDRSFMYKFGRDLPDMTAATNEQASDVFQSGGSDALAVWAQSKMRCGGCGSKVGSSVLSEVLKRLPQQPVKGEVLQGVMQLDDCAVLRPPPVSHLMLQTVDFFRSFLSDPYIFAKVTAVHCLSDIHAMGGQSISALAIVVLPYSSEKKQVDLLEQLMTGAVQVLNQSGCQLVGGHTCEGQELQLGFAIYGSCKEDEVMKKGGMQVGDRLILTKAVGVGALFAAGMQGKVKARWIHAATQSMLHSNAQAAKILQSNGCVSCTDVTGFGLLGHLGEMLVASNTAATLNFLDIPCIMGSKECISNNILSSLHEQNKQALIMVQNVEELVKHRDWPIFVDPQTAGGLLAAVKQQHVDKVLQLLVAEGYEASVIGTVVSYCEDDSSNARIKIQF